MRTLLITAVVVGLWATAGMVVVAEDECPFHSGNVTIGIGGTVTGFNPICVEVDSGTTITWQNNDTTPPNGVQHFPADAFVDVCFARSIPSTQSRSATFYYDGDDFSVEELGEDDCNDAVNSIGESATAEEVRIFYLCQAHPQTMQGYIVINAA